VPLLCDLSSVAHELGSLPPEIFLSDAGQGPLLAGRLALPGGDELLLLANDLYPMLPPLALLTQGGTTLEVELRWRSDRKAEERLLFALRERFVPPGPYRRAFGPPCGNALTRDPERARLADYEVRFGGEDVEAAARALGEARLTRGAGLVTRALREKTVLVAGCGSVGSYLAEQLVRSGLGGLVLVDPERVEAVNLSRTVYEAADVGRAKVEALARRLVRIDAALRLELHLGPFDGLGLAEIDRVVRSADLILATTDDASAQRILNRFAYARGKPALFVGLYAGARGGEVVFTVPERTACYLCATAARHEVEATAGRVAPGTDYGTGRLEGEVALGADVHHVASAAVKLGLSLLVGEGELASLAEEAVEAGQSYLTLSTVPRYWFYPRIFGEAAGQGAYQSVWLTPARRPSCPVCGDAQERVDPEDAPLRVPRTEALETLLGDGS
jgi:molybdopterin/thiamine biosynthesis adenylyltransferase